VPRPDRLLRLARRLVAGLAAGVVAGLVCGGLARILMRVVSVVGDDAPEFSWSGTAFIILLFVVAAVPGAMVAAGYRGRGRSLPLVTMSLLLWLPAASIARTDLSELTDITAVEWVGVALATAGIYLLIAAMPMLALRLVRRWADAGRSVRARPRHALVTSR
jgi:uncharacterized membrane protein YhaH (DUF805 family)